MKDFVKSLFCESSGSRLSKSTKLRMEALESRQLLDAAGLAAIVNAEDVVAETVVVAEPTAVEPIDISQIDDGSMEEYTLSVSTTDPHVGVRVTATLTPSAEATYQWYADGEAIADAVSTYYYPTANLTGKTLSVTASIVDGPEVSAEVGVISQTLSKVTIANTIPVVGVGLTTYTTPVTQSVSAQWYRVSDGEATAIDGATGLNYVPTAEDVGCYLKIVVEGENGYQGTVEKTTSVAVLATSPLTISPEDAKIGVQLDAVLTPADSNATYQWYRLVNEGWEWIDGATDSSFTPTKDNLGETLRVAATYAEGEYAGMRAFAVTSVITPTIELSTYEPTWGRRVIASLDPVDSFATYQWYSGSDETGWTAIDGAT